MSSPSPSDIQKSSDHAYQTSETSEHSLLKHPHVCSCCEKDPPPKTDLTTHCHLHPKVTHTHNVINLSHGNPTSHIHPTTQSVHVHVHASPKSGSAPKLPPSAVCNCHLEEGGESGQEIREGGGIQETKQDADDRIEISPLPPALPPRPPPRPRIDGQGTLGTRGQFTRVNPSKGGIRKYVFWCCVCGGLATILGSLFLAVYFLLRSYTSTLGYFETIPTFVPAAMLILTGLCVISLARRKNRYSYLIKVCGICCLVCALTCVLVTITTTVIHMNRLQTLRECVYTQKTRTCTCYSVLLEAHASTEEGMRFVFDSTPDCEVIHGALYSCLRAMFGLSVSGILVCIFSCMLVYQLLSHEKKKMYWEQLELRCRSFYQQHCANPPSTHGSMRGPPVPPATYCSCCDECRYPPLTAGPHVYPWDTHHSSERFWTPGRVGNFYSPNPGEELGPASGDVHVRERTAASGWNWRRLPWNRGNTTQNDPQSRENSLTYQGATSSADSQYGFSNRSGGESNVPNDQTSASTGSYSMLDNRPVGGVYVWGPPPPYSNPNSPARMSMNSPARFHHVHHHLHGHESHCQMSEENHFRNTQELPLRRSRVQFIHKDNYENTAEAETHHQCIDNSESTDTSSCADRISHTLPVRKVKKRIDLASVKSTAQTPCRTNVQNVFANNQNFNEDNSKFDEGDAYRDSSLKEANKQNSSDIHQCRFLPRLQGVENEAFQKQENSPQRPEATESEVYFADVSSCCNISVKNDGQDSSLYDEALEGRQKPRLSSLHCIHKEGPKEQQPNFPENICSCGATEDDQYLNQRIDPRQMSTRSRMPFPISNDCIPDPASKECLHRLPKDISQSSLCSSVQTPLTETTDDNVSLPSPNFPKAECCTNFPQDKNIDKNPAKHRNKSFSNTSLDQFLAPDAQYEIIQDQEFRHNFSENKHNNLTTTISGLNFSGPSFVANKNNFAFNACNVKNVPPKTLNLNQSRRNLGTNISTLIQNLGANPAGLLYGEANSAEEESQGQGSHSDCTMDSGWQSGSEKQEKREENQDLGHKSVSV